ncbi:acyl-CoA dehydrogenase family member 11-like [Ylistrum balloti]|uniref:acyl-CoA dehydrogenase family member 11-like n=1 Tax=Ylistrum balloti TaxID=509963 RepID=UPI0029059833|nr:acyl-CoA dehydrogenase family member 11-like [Ylistrum balloti]
MQRFCSRNNLLLANLGTRGILRNVTAATSSETYLKISDNQKNVEPESYVVPFAKARIGNFFQEKPSLGNHYREDHALQSYLKRHIPSDIFTSKVEPDLHKFGQRVTSEIVDLGQQCDTELPYVEHFDPWGQRIDRLVTCPAWNKLHDISAEEGIISIAYNREIKEYSRLHQMAKVYLFASFSGLYSCPIAMTDGAAKIVENLTTEYPWLKERAFGHLTSRQPGQFWTSGQWMTERKGGSDVANGTETIAIPQDDGSFRLHGYKWFSSATDADITFTLARVVGKDGQTTKGTRGLSLFYVEVHNVDGSLNNIQIQKLKNKLGTKQVPTAELLLDGTVAHKVSDEGRGVASISSMLTLSRIHNALASASSMRRMVNTARDYSTRRSAFGNVLKSYPLHIQTLARLEVEVRGALLLTLEAARLLGREDVGIATEHEQMLLRLLTPLAKLYTAKQAMSVVSEGLESFGGQGYIEDTGLPGLLRDSQVLPIWEGTTNVLSLDVLRALMKTNGGVLKVWHDNIIYRIESAGQHQELSHAAEKVTKCASSVVDFAKTHSDVLDNAARDFAYSLSRTFIGALLVQHAVEAGSDPTDIYAAQRWCEKDLTPVITNQNRRHFSSESTDLDFQLLFKNYHDRSRL